MTQWLPQKQSWDECSKTMKTRAKDVLPNMHRTQAAVSVYCRHPITPACDAMVSSATACSVRHTPYYTLSMGMTQQFFCPWWPWPWPLTFKPVPARDQTRLLCKFGANPFSRSGDITVTKQKTTLITDSTKREPYLHAVIKENALQNKLPYIF